MLECKQNFFVTPGVTISHKRDIQVMSIKCSELDWAIMRKLYFSSLGWHLFTAFKQLSTELKSAYFNLFLFYNSTCINSILHVKTVMFIASCTCTCWW